MPRPRVFRWLPALIVVLLVTLAASLLPVYGASPIPDTMDSLSAPDQLPSSARASSPIALTSDNRLLVVCNPDSDSISVFLVQADTNRKLAEIRVGREPRSVAIHPNNQFALVTNQGSGTVSVIDLRQLRRTQDVQVGAEPYGVVITPDGREAWITLSGLNGSFFRISFVAQGHGEIPALAAGEMLSVQAPTAKTAAQPEIISLRGIAVVTRNGQDFLYMTQFLSNLPQNGQQMNDQGKNGHVFVVPRLTPNQVTDISLAPHETGFDADRTNFGGSATTPTFAFPNQLQAIAVKGSRLYLPNTSASPEAPVKFDVDTQAFLGVIETNTNQELGAFNINLNLAVKQQTATPKLFLAVPWAAAFENGSNEGYVASSASNVVAKITLSGAGQPSVVLDTVTGGTRVREIAVGKNPQGLVISSNDRRAYVMNYVSRDVSVIDLTRNPETVIATFQSAALPRQGTLEDRIHVGKELFNTSVGVFDQRDPATNQPIQGRMSNNGWQGCVSCHPAGLTDGVVWQFPAGPRKSIPMNTSFNPNNPNEARLLNYSAIFDEVNDFEINIRNVSGGQGVIITDTLTSFAPHPILRAFDPANFGRRQLTVRGVNALDAVTEYAKRGIRSPISGENPNNTTVQRGRQLFIQANCQACHGGSFWTNSIRDFNPPPPANRLRTGQAPEPALQFVFSVLRQVGTFDATKAVEHTAANQAQRPLGAQGFNVPSLIGVGALGPYNHNGECETLDCVLTNVTHRSAGVRVDVLTNASDRDALVRFLRSIDLNTRPIPLSRLPAAKAEGAAQTDLGYALSAEPRSLSVARTQSGQASIVVEGNVPVRLAVDASTVPAGVTATLGTPSGSGAFNSTLTVSASLTAQNGQHYIRVCGDADGDVVDQCVEVPVNIFGYQLNPTVNRAYIRPGAVATFWVQAESLGGNVPNVTLNVSGAPAGATLSYAVPGSDEEFTDPPTGTPFDDFPFVTIIKVTTTAQTPAGTFTLTVRANGEGLQREASLTLQVGGTFSQLYLPHVQRNPVEE